MVEPPDTLPSSRHEVSQDQLARYADTSGDWNPLHLDPAFAAATPYGRPIAHGMLVLAFLSDMLSSAFGLSWSSGGKLRVRFRAPVYPGDVVVAEGALRKRSPPAGEVTYDVTCRSQTGEPVITGEATLPWPMAVEGPTAAEGSMAENGSQGSPSS